MTKKRITKRNKEPAVDYPWIDEKLQGLAVPIDELELDPANARVHNEQNIKAVMKSLRRRGQYSPLLVNAANNQVVIGNCRLVAARRLGWTHVAVIRRQLTAAEQAEMSIVDNRTGELGEWDGLLLEASLATVEESNADLADLLRLQLAIEDVDKRRGKRDPDLDGSPQLGGLEYRIIVVCKGSASFSCIAFSKILIFVTVMSSSTI